LPSLLLLSAGVAVEAASLERRVAAASDDAEESASGSVSLSSGDLELTYDSSLQIVGLRFAGVGIPRGSLVTAAWVQFEVDETDATDTRLSVRAEASDSAGAFTTSSRNLSLRPTTLASVSWTPPAWGSTGAAGADQRTPDLSVLLNEIVSRPGWRGDGAVALLVTGTGRRVAASYDGDSSASALLHVEYVPPPANSAPRVDAGADGGVALPAPLGLRGSVADDGLPATPGRTSARWSQAGGPGQVWFEDASSPATSAWFGAPGLYVLRLSADDGELSSSDSVTVSVSAAPNLPPQGVIMSPSGPVTVVAGMPVNFQGASLDGNGDAPLRHAWDFGGAAPARHVEDPGAIVLSAPGVYLVRYTVTDPAGLSDPTPDARLVTVVPAPGSRTFHVAPSGSDSNDGSLSRPFRTVSHAAGLLLPGDRLLLRQGTYHERVTVRASGTALAPIVIDSYPGERAVIDSALPQFRSPGNRDWELVDASLGEYRSVNPHPSGVARGFVLGVAGYENQRVGLVPYESAAAFRSAGTQYVDGDTPFYVGPGVFQESDGRIHVRLAKTPDMKAIESREGPVLAGDMEDPRNLSLLVATASWTMTVRGSHLVFRNITFQTGTRTIQLAEGARDVVFDGVTAWGGASAIAVTGSGVSRIQIVNSRLYGDVPRWIAWSDAKNDPAPANLMRSTLLALTDGARDIEISYSHLRGAHDGIGVNENEDNLVVHHCRIENFQDDAFELEGSIDVGRVAIYENYIGNSLTAIAPGQATPMFSGPLLVYRNVIAMLRPPFVNRVEGLNGWNGGGRFGHEYMFKHGEGSGYSTANAHYYHNTLLLLGSDGQGINIIPKHADDTRIANNLLMTVNGEVNRDIRLAPGQVLDGDLYWKMNPFDGDPLVGGEDTIEAFRAATGLESRGQGSVPGQGTNPLFVSLPIAVIDRTAAAWELLPQSENPGPAAFLLSAVSPAVKAGIEIPPHPLLGRLPDSRRSRDIGALPLGTGREEFLIFPFTP
jgi:hypothetical protein